MKASEDALRRIFVRFSLIFFVFIFLSVLFRVFVVVVFVVVVVVVVVVAFLFIFIFLVCFFFYFLGGMSPEKALSPSILCVADGIENPL